jgi:hypothetical protein
MNKLIIFFNTCQHFKTKVHITTVFSGVFSIDHSETKKAMNVKKIKI